MKNNNFLTIITIVTLLFSGTINAKVWRVNNNSAYNQWANANDRVFNTLQAAIDHELVEDGDTLYVEASATTYGTINLNKSLTIIGPGYFLDENLNLQNNTNKAIITRINFLTGSNGSSLYGLYMFYSTNTSVQFSTPVENITISRCFMINIEFANNSGNINNLLISKNYLNNIYGNPGTGTMTLSNLIIKNNYFAQNVYLKNTTISTSIFQNVISGQVSLFTNVNFYNNICLNTITGFLDENDNSGANIHHNIFKIAQSGLSWLTGGSNSFSLQDNYLFTNTTDTSDKKWQLKPQNQCPECYLGYPSNIQIGMYGGGDSYIPSGIPAIPTIYNLSASAQAQQGGQLQTTISTRSNN